MIDKAKIRGGIKNHTLGILGGSLHLAYLDVIAGLPGFRENPPRDIWSSLRHNYNVFWEYGEPPLPT